MTGYAGLTLQLSLHTRAWYLDKFGMERECVVVTGQGLGADILFVMGLDGEQLDVRPEDLYYVPQGEESGDPVE